MTSSNNSDRVFNSYLKINYDKRFIPLAKQFTENLSELAGANEKESFQLSRVVNDSLEFIIDKFIDDGLQSHIELCFQLLSSSKIEFKLTHLGLPIHEEKIPPFDMNNISETDGFWYWLTKNIVDDFKFVNNLNKGWIIKITKNLDCFSFVKNNHEENNQKEFGKISSRIATPEDAAELVDLAYLTYRYTNGVPEFYDTNLLKNQIANNYYVIMVFEIENKIIGTYMLKYTDDLLSPGELGSSMVDPEYRKSTVALQIIRSTSKYLRENPRNKDFFVAYLVTTHKLSQRATARTYNGFKPFSISLGMIPRPDYVNIKDNLDSRESILNAYHFYNKLKSDVIYSSEENKKIITEIISNSGNEIPVSTEEQEPESSKTQISNYNIEPLKSTILSLDSFGRNWLSDLRKELFKHTSIGIKTVIVNIPSDKPLPKVIDEKLASLNLVFCGLVLKSVEEIKLSYVLTMEPIHFELIKLDSPVAQNLLQHIKNRYQSILG